MYLDLLKSALLNSLYRDHVFKKDGLRMHAGELERLRDVALTGIGRIRLTRLQEKIEDVLLKNVTGDLIETGTWRGGTVIFMAGVLKAHGASAAPPTVYGADVFTGLPPHRQRDSGPPWPVKSCQG